MTGKSDAGIVQETGVLDRCSADDHVAQTAVQTGFDGVEIANAAAQLDGDFIADFSQDGLDRRRVFRFAGKGPVQVDQMQAAGALGKPVTSLFSRAFGKNSGLFHQALLQTDALAVLQVNRRNNQHGSLGE